MHEASPTDVPPNFMTCNFDFIFTLRPEEIAITCTAA
jgi:hypothetical protein